MLCLIVAKEGFTISQKLPHNGSKDSPSSTRPLKQEFSQGATFFSLLPTQGVWRFPETVFVITTEGEWYYLAPSGNRPGGLHPTMHFPSSPSNVQRRWTLTKQPSPLDQFLSQFCTMTSQWSRQAWEKDVPSLTCGHLKTALKKSPSLRKQ